MAVVEHASTKNVAQSSLISAARARVIGSSESTLSAAVSIAFSTAV